MVQFWLSLVLVANMVMAWRPFDAQFVRSAVGENVSICLDGQNVHSTFAGKLGFRDNSGTWLSVCADVRSPIMQGQISTMHPANSAKVGGRVAAAGDIVAHFFRQAQSPDECAALQLAVWKVLEDGPGESDFGSGHFQAMASSPVISLAQQFIVVAALDKSPEPAAYLATTGGQSQLTSTTTSSTDK